MKYFVDDEEVTKEEFYSQLEDTVNNESDEQYDDMLNDAYGDIDVCGYMINASYALQQCDPTAYRCGLCDYKSAQLEEKQNDFENENEEKIDGTWFRTEE